MTTDLTKLQESLCKAMCSEVRIVPKNKGLAIVRTPFSFPDGDPYQVYLKELPGGLLRVSDMGHTLGHLSYENDTDKLRKGTRGKLFDQIMAEGKIAEDDGEFYVDSAPDGLAPAIFRLSHALIKLNDITFLNRARAESTFYEDLRESLMRIIPAEKIHEDYVYENMDNARDYPIDYLVEGKHAPLFVFGVPNKDKARLATIVLERLKRANADFDSLLIFADQGTIPRPDLARLSNVGGEMIASLDAREDFERKLLRKVA